MSDTVARIAEFPNDDRYWVIRWIDTYEVVSGRTATPSVGVILIPTANNPALKNFRSSSFNFEEECQCRVHVGFIPLLILGSIFKNGIFVGRIEAETRTVTLRKNESPYQIPESVRPAPGSTSNPLTCMAI
nr:hypothetical protein [uncultured Halomonas sp.]